MGVGASEYIGGEMKQAYDEATRAIEYIRWPYGDAEQIAPSLYATRKRRQSESEEPATYRTGPSGVWRVASAYAYSVPVPPRNVDRNGSMTSGRLGS